MTSKVPKGLATWAGLIAAVGQYALAVALFLDTMDATDPLAGVAPLLTATATLWKVIEGRMSQARTLAGIDGERRMADTYRQYEAADKARALRDTLVASTFTEPRAGAETRTVYADEPEEGCGNTFEGQAP
jgi:hypothetical protein